MLQRYLHASVACGQVCSQAFRATGSELTSHARSLVGSALASVWRCARKRNAGGGPAFRQKRKVSRRGQNARGVLGDQAEIQVLSVQPAKRFSRLSVCAAVLRGQPCVALGFVCVVGRCGGKQNAGNPASTSMLTLCSLTLRSKGHLSVPGRDAGWRMFHLAAGYYKVPLNSTLGFLRIGLSSCSTIRAGVFWLRSAGRLAVDASLGAIQIQAVGPRAVAGATESQRGCPAVR